FLVFSFFLQAEDCIRDRNVTGVQQCALPISSNCNAYATQFETYGHDHSPPRRCSASNCNAYALNLRHTAMTILHRGGVLHPIAMIGRASWRDRENGKYVVGLVDRYA